MKLTIGLPHYEDFHGLFFTVQSLKMLNDVSNVELIIVENGPPNTHQKTVKSFIGGDGGSGFASSKIVQCPEKGSATAKGKVFDHASGDVVAVVDCHVLFWPNIVDNLLAYFSEPENAKNIATGPLVLDNMKSYHTHFDNRIRGQMWGTWGTARMCKCKGFLFSPTEAIPDKMDSPMVCRKLDAEGTPVSHCPSCKAYLPVCKFSEHIQKLEAFGAEPYGRGPHDLPFIIPGSGMGFFAMMKEHWVGFNPHTKGFGGEEMYVHEKVRRNGGHAVCVPNLAWVHRFPRPDGVPHKPSQWDKVRNMVLNFQELGLDLKPIYEHFVATGAFSPGGDSKSDWASLLANPVEQRERPIRGCSQPAAHVVADIQEAAQIATNTKRDLNEHMPKLSELAKNARVIVEFTERRESTLAFLAGNDEAKLISFQTENEPLLGRARQLPRTGEWTTSPLRSPSVDSIPECDLLFLDNGHTEELILEELRKFAKSAKRIAIHDTVAYGATGEGHKEGHGIVAGIRRYLEEDKDLFLYGHTNVQHGLTLLSRLPEDRPPYPLIMWDPGFGPGTEFKKIAERLGFSYKAQCSCEAMRKAMDTAGVAGCKHERANFLKSIKANAEKWGWADMATAIKNAATSGLIFKINPLDPVGSIYDAAVTAAEKAQSVPSQSA